MTDSRPLIQFTLIQNATLVLNNALRWGGLVAMAFFAERAIEALAGKTTFADIVVQFMANVKVAQTLSYAIGIGGLTFGLFQKRLRRTTIERLTKRIQSLERMLDPERSTSGLTPRGETNPEDRL